MNGKTRIAPTPSGFLHFGNAYAFVKTYLLAKRDHLKILLRIDDLDRQRYRQKYVEGLFQTLHYLHIEYDEGPQTILDFERTWSQKNRMDLYQGYLNQLMSKELLFACACSRKEIAQHSTSGIYSGTCLEKAISPSAKNVAWRFNTGINTEVHFRDWKDQIQSHTLPASMWYFVVRRKDKIPAYQLASLADDVHFNITHVVRGEDLLDSTLAQLALAQSLAPDFSRTKFYHHPLIHSPQGEKLSKSQQAAPVLAQLKKDKTAVFFRLSECFGFKEKYASLAEMQEALLSGEEAFH